MAKLTPEILAATKKCHDDQPGFIRAKLAEYETYLQEDARVARFHADRFVNALDHGDGKTNTEAAIDALNSLSGRSNFHELVSVGRQLISPFDAPIALVEPVPPEAPVAPEAPPTPALEAPPVEAPPTPALEAPPVEAPPTPAPSPSKRRR